MLSVRWLGYSILLCGVALLVLPSGAADVRHLPGVWDDDDRVTVEADTWPWSAIGRVNRATGGFCTGTLIGPRHVLTAAHCLYDPRRRRWALPDAIHFVAGYRRGAYLAHAVAAGFAASPDYSPDAAGIDNLTRDWAIIVLRDAVPIRPLAWRDAEGGPPAADEPVLRAGYGQDRPHLLTMHRDCAVTGVGAAGLLQHSCDAAPGDSGSPLLVLSNDEAVIIGLHVAVAEGIAAGLAVPSTAFAEAAHAATAP